MFTKIEVHLPNKNKLEEHFGKLSEHGLIDSGY